jgi:hypothetical protein
MFIFAASNTHPGHRHFHSATLHSPETALALVAELEIRAPIFHRRCTGSISWV